MINFEVLRKKLAKYLRDEHGGYLYDEMDEQYIEAESLMDAEGILDFLRKEQNND